jgi:NCS2 family nucleobase:cation symporter-2
MPRKPSNLLFGVEEKPSLFVTFILGLQHVFILFISLIFPVVIIKELGSDIEPGVARAFISLSMVAGGITTILQALKKGPVGSGYLCPSVCGPSYLSASITAAHAGGLPLLFGMTGFTGLMEVIFSRIMHKLRFLFPSEVTGVIVTMVGIMVISLSVQNFLGLSGTDTLTQIEELLVAFATLGTIVALNVYSKGRLRLYCITIGMIVGYTLSYFLGIIPHQDILSIKEADIFALPHVSHLSWKFDLTMIIPFIVATLCSSLKTVGDLVTCQKINDADWKRPDMKSVAGGIFADGMGGIIPGLIGGFGQSTSSSNVGLSIATGATSRIIAYPIGIIIIILAFLPKFAQIFIIMPKPVIGATLIFAVSFMIVAGLQIIMTRMLDARKTFVVGISLIFGISADMLPEVYKNVHPWIQPIFNSSLSLTAVTAIVLNLIFRIGIAKSKTLDLIVGKDTSEKIFTFMEAQGGAWGARKEVVYKAISAMNEFWESVNVLGLCKKKVRMDVRFDEYNLDIDIHYDGVPMEFPIAPPERSSLVEDEKILAKLSGFLIRHYVDRIKSEEKNGHCHVHLYLDH